MVTSKYSIDLDDLLYGDQGKYGYLFPYRNRVPKIKKHLFDGMSQSKQSADEFVISKMLKPEFIGWTAKTILNIDLFPIQIATLQVMWDTPFPLLVASRGGSKSFMLAVYAVLKALLDPGTKVAIIGGGLRQARLVFNYIDNIWNSSPVLRSIVGGGRKAGPKQNVDLCYFKIGESVIYALPLGDGTKIRGFRANIIIADEFAAIPEDIFDIVVRGFAATTKTPVDEARRLAFERDFEKIDMPDDVKEAMTKDAAPTGNQIIYSGTAYYEFNHFAKKFNMWKSILQSKGDLDRVSEIFGGANMIPENFNHNDYAIIRIPYNYLPDGLLDQRQLAHAKALLPRNIFLMEYGGIFVKDSDGFFPRSLIESCSTGPSKPIATPDGDVTFTPLMAGIKGRRYVVGIDPAAERDNLTIVVLEVWPNHYRVVYCWAVNKGEFNKRKKQGLLTNDDYYAYCCSKIRWVVRHFAPVRIEMDSQGGGGALSEMLRNKKLLEEGELPIYEIIDYDNPKPEDGEKGLHILELVDQSSKYNAEANVALKASLETKRLLFPAFDTVKMQSAIMAEKSLNITFDTFEENVNNIEELKNELCIIQVSETTTGKERFDTPTVAQAASATGIQRKGRLRKDRYTALLISHKWVYENDVRPEVAIDYEDVAGNIQKVDNLDPTEGLYRGPGVGSMRNSKDWVKGGGGEKNFGATKRGERI